MKATARQATRPVQRPGLSRRIASRCLPCALALFAVLTLTTLARACPNCANGQPEQAGGDIVSGYFYSILFMLFMPFSILGGFSGYMYYLVRKDRAAKAAQQPTRPALKQATRSLAQVGDSADSPEPAAGSTAPALRWEAVGETVGAAEGD